MLIYLLEIKGISAVCSVYIGLRLRPLSLSLRAANELMCYYEVTQYLNIGNSYKLTGTPGERGNILSSKCCLHWITVTTTLSVFKPYTGL